MDSSVPPPDGVAACNSSDTLRVWVSHAGLPLYVQIAPSLLSQGAEELAAEVVRLCRTGRP
jgi:hypothetical protein